MTLKEAIDGACREWWGVHTPGFAVVKSGTDGLADKIEHAVTLWMAEQDCRLDQIVALSKAGLSPCLRPGIHWNAQKDYEHGGWNLQLSPEAGHLVDFDGATLEDVLQEACEKYLPKEATT